MHDIRYQFDTLETDRSNEEAIHQCKNICENPKASFGLWLFGPSGCGKTHLLKAVYNSLKYQESKINAVYISAKELCELLYDFLAGGNNLWLHIQTYDVLLMDDADYLLGRPKTQEVVAEMIAEMRENRRCVLLASLCAPDEMHHLQTALMTRNCALSTVELQLPSYSLKKAVVESYLKKNPFGISVEAQELLIVKSSQIPKLKGILNSAKLLSDVYGVCIDEHWIDKGLHAL